LSIIALRVVNMILVALFFLFLNNIAPIVCRTHEDTYFPGDIMETIFNVEWITCLQACHGHPGCISYNYHRDNNTCQINSDGLKEQCDSKSKIFSRGWTFHQIRVRGPLTYCYVLKYSFSYTIALCSKKGG